MYISEIIVLFNNLLYNSIQRVNFNCILYYIAFLSEIPVTPTINHRS